MSVLELIIDDEEELCNPKTNKNKNFSNENESTQVENKNTNNDDDNDDVWRSIAISTRVIDALLHAVPAPQQFNSNLNSNRSKIFFLLTLTFI